MDGAQGEAVVDRVRAGARLPADVRGLQPEGDVAQPAVVAADGAAALVGPDDVDPERRVAAQADLEGYLQADLRRLGRRQGTKASGDRD